MAMKYTRRVTIVALFVAASAFASTADLHIRLDAIDPWDRRVDPGASVTYKFWALSSGPDPVEARFVMPLPPGARFASVSDARWRCSADANTLTCTKSMKPPMDYYDSFFDINIVAPDDTKGSITDTTARVESDAFDPHPDSNSARSQLTVFHTFTVTTPDDFGMGSLRAAIEQANDECDGALPCKIRFDHAMHVAPKSPLPAISGCDVTVDGGAYDPYHFQRNRYFDQARRVAITGDQAGSGSGLAVASQCGTRVGGVILRGLAIGGFSENGIDVRPENDHGVTVDGCFIGTDAAGETAVPNGLRGVSANAPKGSLNVNNSLIAGNRRSGIALYNIQHANISGNLIGVRFGAIPMPNGASGAYVDGGFVRFNSNAIEYNHEFGVAVGPHAARVISENDYIIANGGLAFDRGLDGPSTTPGLPPVPRLTDAFFDAANRYTVVRGVLAVTPLTQKGFYAVRFFLSAGDYEGGIQIWPQTNLISAEGEVPFEIRLSGDRTGQRIGAHSVMYVFPDGPPVDSSEFSASIVVR
jgi:hypothetical protein